MSEPIDNVSNEGLVRVVHEEGFKFFNVNWTAFSMRDRVLRPYPFTASGVEWGVRLSSAHARSVVILTTIVTDVKEGTGVLQTRSVVIVIIAGHLALFPLGPLGLLAGFLRRRRRPPPLLPPRPAPGLGGRYVGGMSGAGWLGGVGGG